MLFHIPGIRRPRSYGVRQNTAITFDAEKLERCGYPTVKKFDMFSRYDTKTDVLRTDGRTDGHAATA